MLSLNCVEDEDDVCLLFEKRFLVVVLPCLVVIDELLVEEASRFLGLSFLSSTSLRWDNLSSLFLYSSIACLVPVRGSFGAIGSMGG